MVASPSKLATALLLSLALQTIAAPISGKRVVEYTEPIISESTSDLSSDASGSNPPSLNSTSTRSSKYAIDYLPTFAAHPSPYDATYPTTIAESNVIPTSTRASKYAIDYLPTRAVRPLDEGDAVERVPSPTSTRSSKYAVDYLPTWALTSAVPSATAEASSKPTSLRSSATSIRPSKYAIDYLPTRSIPPPPRETQI